MAFDTRETIIANPGERPAAKKARKANMAKLSLKQKLHFGSKRQRAAAKLALKTKRKNSAKKAHKKRTRPAAKARKKVNRAAPRRKQHSKRTNPGELISVLLPGTTGNPARKGKKKMAATKKHRRKNKAHSSGSKRRRKNPARRHHTRRNPGMGQVGDLLMLGAGAVVGSSGSTMLTQAVLQGNNSGFIGYAGNLAATGILAWLGHKFVKSKSLASGILAGGVGSVIRRIITDNSLLGSYSAQLGMSGFGDYMAANFVWPQILPSAQTSAMVQIPNGWAPTTVVQSASPSGMGDILGRPLY